MAARTIASNRRLVGVTASMLSSGAVDSTGLICTLAFDRAVTAGSGSPYATPFTLTADGLAASANYVSGSGTNSWQYAITNGNPSGSPILAGADVRLTAAAGVWTAGGVPSVAVVDGVVVNGSGVLLPMGVSGLVAGYLVGTQTYSDTSGLVPAVNTDPVARINDLSANGLNVTQSTLADRPILSVSGSRNLLTYDATDRLVSASNTGITWENGLTVYLKGRLPLAAAVGEGSFGQFLNYPAQCVWLFRDGSSDRTNQFLIRTAAGTDLSRRASTNQPAAATGDYISVGWFDVTGQLIGARNYWANGDADSGDSTTASGATIPNPGTDPIEFGQVGATRVLQQGWAYNRCHDSTTRAAIVAWMKANGGWNT